MGIERLMHFSLTTPARVLYTIHTAEDPLFDTVSSQRMEKVISSIKFTSFGHK